MIIGIDPGKSGAMVSLTDDGAIVDLIRNEATDTDLWHWMKEQKHNAEQEDESVRIYLEKVASRPGQGVSSMFKFGRSFGFLCGICVAIELPFETVTPQKWQRGLSITKRGVNETQTQFKTRLKGEAQRIFPATKIASVEADAILIAEYGRRLGL